MTYEWKVLNIHEARRAIFNTALLHFGIFLLCAFCYLRKARDRRRRFTSVRGSESVFDDM
jgi:hypothetical protein